MFGSTGSKVGIMEFMEEVDKKIREDREVYGDDYDSDDDDERVIMTLPQQVNTDNNVHLIAEEERSTHFIAIRISDKDIIDNITKVQNQIIEKEEILQDCCKRKVSSTLPLPWLD